MKNKAESLEDSDSRVNIAKDIDKIHEYFDILNMLIGEDDEKQPGLDGLLTKVLERHEGDFFNAFNTHIAKKNLTWFKDESKRLKGLKDKNDIAITAITDQNKQLVENKNYIEGKVKASIRQNKLLKVALEKNNEQVDEINQIIDAQPRSKSKFELYNELRADNEIQKIVSEGATPFDLENKNHQTSGIYQESTDFATDGYTARVTNRNLNESPIEKLTKTASNEVILNTQFAQDVFLPDHSLDFMKDAQFLIKEQIENKEMDKEIENIKNEIKNCDNDIRQLKKQRYCVVWPLSAPQAESRSFEPSEIMIDKNELQEKFLDICNDIRKEVIKTKFVKGTPSLESQMKSFNPQKDTSIMKNQDGNIQNILDLVVTNDDLLNKFYDIVFNSDNQALKLPQVQSGDNKTLQEKLKSIDIKIGTRKYGVLTSEALNEKLLKTSIKDFSSKNEHRNAKRYEGHDLEKAIESKMSLNSKSFKYFGGEGREGLSPFSESKNDAKSKMLSPQIISNFKDSSEIGTKRIKLIDKFGGSVNQTDIKSETPYEASSKLPPVEFGAAVSSSTMMQKYTKPISLSSNRKTKRPNLVIKNGKLLIGSKLK